MSECLWFNHGLTPKIIPAKFAYLKLTIETLEKGVKYVQR